jgi:diacylglycerol kinase family enzyme
MKHVFMFDPKSFHGRQWMMDNILDNIGQFFRTQEKPDWSIQVSRYRRDVIAIIEEEAEKAKPGDVIRIYAIGGEEILFDCINAVAHYPDMQVAAVPYGESSNFLNIFGEGKAESFKDIPSLVKAETIPTDLIRWGVNYALNSCYIGLNSAISAKVKDLKISLNKSSFFLFSKISNFFNYVLTAFNKEIVNQDYIITIDNLDYSGKYSLVHVANGPYYAGKMTGLKNATPNDGMLDVALLKSADPLRTMWATRKYAKGKRPKNCTFVQGKKITIQSDKQMWIQLDNEYMRDTNIKISVVHNAVQMVALDNLTYPLAVIEGL